MSTNPELARLTTDGAAWKRWGPYLSDPAVNPERGGTKAAANYRIDIAGGAGATIRLRLRKKTKEKDFADFDAVVKKRRAECDAFYTALQPTKIDADTRRVQRLAWAGML